MTIFLKKFDQYSIYYMTGGNEAPLIDCYDGTKHVGKLSFEADALSANGVTATEVLYLRYRLSQFNDVVNILRVEKPLYLKFDTSTLKGALATSDREPVGEQET